MFFVCLFVFGLFVCLFFGFCFYLCTISFKFFLYGDPRIIFCTQFCRTIPYLLLTVARAILCECFNFLYKRTLPAFGENIRGIDIQKGTCLLQLGEAKLLGCVWLHKVAYLHSVTHYRVMERYFLMDNVAEVVQCRFFFCCLEIFFIWLIEAISLTPLSHFALCMSLTTSLGWHFFPHSIPTWNFFCRWSFCFVCLFVCLFFFFVLFFVLFFFENLLDFFVCFRAHPRERCFDVPGLHPSAYPILALSWSVSCWSS